MTFNVSAAAPRSRIEYADPKGEPVGAVQWSATDQLVAWCRRTAHVAQRCSDYDGPDPDGPEFERAVVRFLRHVVVWP